MNSSEQLELNDILKAPRSRSFGPQDLNKSSIPGTNEPIVMGFFGFICVPVESVEIVLVPALECQRRYIHIQGR
jgi:hypothetical protein